MSKHCPKLQLILYFNPFNEDITHFSYLATTEAYSKVIISMEYVRPGFKSQLFQGV